jgi:inosine-uridine nucleoside N-ribohydrolase
MHFRRAFRFATNFFAAHRQHYHRKSSSSLYSTSVEKNQMADQILWIDTDCGYDDLCAISLLQGYSINPASRMKIKYFSTVNGMTNPVIGSKVIKNFSEINNLSASVACGFGSLSCQRHSITDLVWGTEYRSSFLSFMSDQHLIQNANIDASTIGEVQTIDCMVKRIIDQKGSNNITLLCLGPLTNIAFIMRKYPSFFDDCIERLVLMGGAVLVNGNAPGGAEYNFYLDPEAASFVFRNCSVPIEMFGLEVANDEALTTDQYKLIMTPFNNEENVANSPSSKIIKFIRSLMEKNKDAISYDSIASYYLICPDAFTLQKMDIVVDNVTGQTKIVSKDDIDIKGVKSTSINVAISVCKSSYINYLLDTLRE